MLDDYSNLSPMGDNGGINSLNNFLQFVFGNTSGPLGRPVSMLSFLIDGQDWPPNIASFKYTNIMIHLLNGLALCWLGLLLFQALNLSARRSAVLALVLTALWLLHPLNSTTTLYAVQRMTQLMTLFALAALICYVKGRLLISIDQKRAAVLLVAALFPFGLLSVLSKENGALLLLLIVIFELSVFSHITRTRLFKLWYRLGVLFPLAIILLYLLLTLPQSIAGFEIRHFSMAERVLTESRILSIYLFKIFFPSGIGVSLFHDDFLVSQSLLNPLTTLFAIVFLVALLGSAIAWRKQQPMFFFGVCWFFAMHLLESGHLPLELYFEHRNYMSMIGPLITLVWYLHRFLAGHFRELSKQTAVGITGLFLLIMAFLSWQQSLLWSNTAELNAYWAFEKPNSSRAQISYGDFLAQNGATEAAMERWQRANSLLPNEVSIQLHIWNRACEYGMSSPITLQQIIDAETPEYFHNDINFHLRELLENLILQRCEFPPTETVVAVFDVIDRLPLSDRRRAGYHFLFSDLYVYLGRLDSALIQLSRSFELRELPEIPIRQAILSASAGNFEDGLVFLQRAREANSRQSPFLPSAEAEIARIEQDFQRLLNTR